MQCAQPLVSGRGYNYFSIEGIFMQALPFLIKRYSLAKPGSSRKKMNKIHFLATFLNLISPFVSKKILKSSALPQNKKQAHCVRPAYETNCFAKLFPTVALARDHACWGTVLRLHRTGTSFVKAS